MTTTKNAATLAKVAETANKIEKAQKGEVLNAKALVEGKKPVELKDLLKVVTEKARLAQHREQLINHLDMINSLEAQGNDDELNNSAGLAAIELTDQSGSRYKIRNAALLLHLVIELKAQIRARISQIETELVK